MKTGIYIEQNQLNSTSYKQNEYTTNHVKQQATESDGSVRQAMRDGQVRVSNTTTLSGYVHSLQKGDLMEGVVQYVKYPQVTLQLENQMLMDALLTEEFSFGVGDKVIFQVKENSMNQLALRPVMIDSQNELVISRALDAAGMPQTQTNKAIVQSLIEHGLPIDKNSILQIVNFTKNNPDIQISTSVMMKQMEIPLKKENAIMFEQWENGNLSLKNELSHLTGQLYEHVLTTATTDSPIQALSLQEKIFQSFLGNHEPVNLVNLVSDQPDILNSQPGVLNSQSDSMNGTIAEAEFSNQTTLAEQTGESGMNGGEGTINANGDMPAKGSLWEQLTRVMGLAKSDDVTASNPTNTSAANNTDVNNTTANNINPNEITASVANTTTASASRSETGSYVSTEQIMSYLTGELSEENMQPFSVKDANQFSQLREAFLQCLRNPDAIDSERLTKLLMQEDVRELIGQVQKDAVHIQADVLENNPSNLKQELQDNYEKIQQMNHQVQEILQQSGHTNSTIFQTNGQIEQHMQFLDSFSQNVTYVPVPLKFSTGQAEGELYVWKRQKTKINPTDTLHAFLHFDLEHLGATDIDIKMLNKRITASFMLDDKKSAKLVEHHLDELKVKLMRKGYTAEISTELVKEPQLVAKRIEGENKESKPYIKRYTFDVMA